MFNRFCMGQQLRILFESHQFPSELDGIIQDYERLYSTDIRGTFRNDTLAFNESFHTMHEEVSWEAWQLTRLPEPVVTLLKGWLDTHVDHGLPSASSTAFIRKHIIRLGEKYETQGTSVANSQVYFRGKDHTMSAGSIHMIFSQSCQGVDGSVQARTFFVVLPYLALSREHALLDNFRQFPITGGRLFYKKFGMPILLSSEDIMFHFVYSTQDLPGSAERCIHALPLDKVSLTTGPFSSILRKTTSIQE